MFQLPDLPYDHAALEPVISRATMRLHHDKHHKAYVDALNTLVAEQRLAPTSLETLIARAAGDPAQTKLANNAGQAWNHAFFWTAMSPRRQTPSGALAQAITAAFGDLEGLKTAMVETGAAHFGSGWVWLAADGADLKVIATHDGDPLITHAGLTPLMVCDLWEHAYYLDHQNDRKGYLDAWFEALANWAFAQDQYATTTGLGQGWRFPEPQELGGGTAVAGGRSL
ncbi:superoxide dismutase [Phenylobacterium aquaticum]|uniref:superoxide dismutase n=1 Tax=Phenylobacterium aquaticum TaxID=1763816 RepID=UPI0026F0929A|nr:superoxide dismutase [Phenylobacterium aquaticum]